MRGPRSRRARGIELPQYRFDEIATTISENRKVHATFIESALVHLKSMYEETLVRYIDGVVKAHPMSSFAAITSTITSPAIARCTTATRASATGGANLSVTSSRSGASR